eukprot:GABV01001937.1.p1 GENE.GABV01001937.1~~GABV01001937.1.p1  ORF type:complete len:177 (+),score=25.60 GABV01001937.1:142-672(+)
MFDDEDGGFFDRQKTFKPKRKIHTDGSRRATLHRTMRASMKATLGGLGDMKKTVVLPEGEDLNEWLAVNTVHFFNAASMVYGTCSEFCTNESCPVMSAGARYEYLWADGVRVKKPVKVSAPQYIDYLFNWIDDQISDPNLFPRRRRRSVPEKLHVHRQKHFQTPFQTVRPYLLQPF